jgi:hypothetical protein
MFQPSSPIVVDITGQPEAARDISIDTVLGIFALAGVFLVAALVVALLGGGTFLIYRRMHGAALDGSDSGLTTLDLSTSEDSTTTPEGPD